MHTVKAIAIVQYFEQLTYSPIKLHANDRVFVSFVLPGAVPELGDPTLCGGVGASRVHEAVGHHHADDCVAMTFHRL